MNPSLPARAAELQLEDAANARLRLAFGLACAARVRHLLTDERIPALLDIGQAFVDGRTDAHALAQARDRARALASTHPGSGMIDGSGNAAVSAAFAAACALEGRAVDAADYAAYAAVYAYASHAVTDPRAYADEHAWQLATLDRLSRKYRTAAHTH